MIWRCVQGCCMWYNEPQYLADIEEHLGVTIQQVDKTIALVFRPRAESLLDS
jgi:hypothetical protein